MKTNIDNLQGWEFWIDRGGTFTDIIAKSPEQKFIIQKILSENPRQYNDSTLEGIRRILNLKKSDPLPIPKIKNNCLYTFSKL